MDRDKHVRLALARRRNVSGQAAVMTMLFAVVLVLVALTLYRTGRLTSDKMELQNAADAMAVSVSKIEARDLNFAAYTNRAMVANEVAIGQAIGMASWALHHQSIGNFLQAYDSAILGPATLGVSTPIINGIANGGFIIPARSVLIPFMRGYAQAMTTINYWINQAYGISQQVFHVATIISSFGLYQDLLRDNAPDGAHMSAYGMMMLISHIATYGGLPTSQLVASLPASMQSTFAPFTKSYDPGFTPFGRPTPVADLNGSPASNSSNTLGYGRLAAIINNSGDPFTKGEHNPPFDMVGGAERTGRGWTLNFFAAMARMGIIPNIPPLTFNIPPVMTITGNFGIQNPPPAGTAPPPDGWLGFRINGAINILGLVGANFNFQMALRLMMLRQGGSELRMMVPLAGTNRNKATGQNFSWSSADTANFDLGFAGNGGISAWFMAPSICGSFPGYYPCFRRVTLGGARFVFAVGSNRLNMSITLPGVSVLGIPPTNIPIYNGRFPTRVPLGAAFAKSGRATGTKPNELTGAPKHAWVDPLGPIPTEAYGKAAENDVAWYFPGLGMASQAALPTNNVASQYRGLPPYLDTTGSEPMFKSGGPLLVVGLSMDEDDVEAEHYDENPGSKPTGQFNLDEGFACNAMSAVAKSEVYFKRPNDLSYFRRGDGYVEHGSAFNPYWQARLVETSHADRVMSLFLEHREIAQTIPGANNLLNALNPLLQFLQQALPVTQLRTVGC